MQFYISFSIDYYELTMSCMENSVDPDQLASEEASWSGSTLFQFSLYLDSVFKESMYGYQQSKG